jgi:bifunctional non-homologous end joining protein LigD
MEKSRSHSSLLQTYRHKRDFSKTTEPSGKDAVKGTGHAFVVQKHAASHPHYDFRLEMDGVLKSWAVAKGPSVDPAVKRLAIETEDHPLAYGCFEGVIPKGQYGGGTVMLWDRGTWRAVGDPNRDYKAGRLRFRLNGNKMKGQWALVRMKPRDRERSHNWLLIKDRDTEAAPGNPDKLLKQDKSVKTGREMQDIAAGKDVWVSGKSKPVKGDTKRVPKPKRAAETRAQKPPPFIAPQLATRVDKPPAAKDWLHEIKFDGYRLHCRLAEGKVSILTRHGADWTAKFKGLADAMKRLPAASAYLDGEAVILNDAGITDFSALQAWFKSPGRRQVTFYAFDILFLDGEDLRQLSLLSRKEILRDLIARAENAPEIRYSDHQIGSGPAFFTASASLGVEGIISKDAAAAYVSGRSRSWLKIKRIERQEFVIGGYTSSSTGADRIGALLLGEFVGKRPDYVGKVGTGFSAADSKSLFIKLSRLKKSKAPFASVPAEVRRTAFWTKPELVAEIEFGAWISDHILRHAVFLGVREDKEPADVKAEKALPVRDIVTENEKPKRVTASSASAKRRASLKPGAKVAGVTITHPERLIYPHEKVTKLDVARYYDAVATVMLPHVAKRPLSLVRCPDGIGPACFFQKHAGAGLPEGVEETRIGSGKGDSVLTIGTSNGLVSLVQRGVLEVHIWGSHLSHVEQPDLVVFDFDPDTAVKWAKVREAALAMRGSLEELGLKSFVKTTGGKGLHVVVPVKPALEWDGIKQFAKIAAQRFSESDPSTYLVNMSKKARSGRIFIDYLRNGRGATAVAPYSTRARPGATVATPLAWKELEDGAVPQDFTIATVTARISKRFKDPWKAMAGTKQRITVKMIEALAGKPKDAQRKRGRPSGRPR